MSESQLKNKHINSYQAELHPMEVFKLFLADIIKNKSSRKDSSHKQASITHPFPTLSFPTKRSSVLKKEEDQLGIIIEANKEKNQALMNSCKKLKQKMRLEKIDPAMKFFKHNVKPFSELKTFINAREFLEKANPIQLEPIFHDNQYKQEKSIHILQKLHRQSVSFFEDKNKEFIYRLNELNKKKNTLKKKEPNSQRTPTLSSDSSLDEKLERIPKNIPIYKKKEQSNNKGNKIRNNCNEANRKKVISTTEYDSLKKQIMKVLIKDDDTYNKKDFQIENEISADATLNEFYAKTLTQFQKQKQNKILTQIDFDKDLESLVRLEKIVASMIQNKVDKPRKVEREQEIFEKYQEYKKKTSQFIKLMGKTSKTLLNDSNIEKKASQSYRFSAFQRKYSNDKGTSTIFNQTNLERRKSTFSNEKIDNNLLKYNKKLNNSVRNSFFMPAKKSLLINPLFDENAHNLYFENVKKSSKILSYKNQVSSLKLLFIQGLKIPKSFYPPEIFENKHKKIFSLSLTPRNHEMNNQKIIGERTKDWTNQNDKINIMNKMNDILLRTNSLNHLYQDSKGDLLKLITESDDFYSETYKKINPTLDSLTSTFGKPIIDNVNKMSNHKGLMNKKRPLIIL